MSDDAGGEARERSAGFVITTKRGGTRQFLVLRHRGSGHWAFPKGRVEAGEDDLSAATRETMEETGIGDIEPVPVFRAEGSYCFERDGRTISKRVTYFLAEVGATAVELSDEHEESRWLEAGEALELLTYDESRRVLTSAVRHLGGR